MNKPYLAIDAGGSRTRAAVYDGAGTLLGQGEGGPANPNYTPLAEVRGALRTAAAAACDTAGVSLRELTAVGAGLAGAGLSDVASHPAAPEWFRSLWEAPSAAVWDAVIALRGAIPAGAGAVVLAGTGSAVYARSAGGRHARVGGWGAELPSEWGADAIARRAIAAAVEAIDGRRSPSPLTEGLAAELGLPALDRLVGADRARIAALAARVGEFAEPDPVARGILEDAAREMARGVTAALRRTGQQELETTVSWTGSVFAAGPAVLAPLAAFLAESSPRAKLEPPVRPPLYGAFLIAKEIV